MPGVGDADAEPDSDATARLPSPPSPDLGMDTDSGLGRRTASDEDTRPITPTPRSRTSTRSAFQLDASPAAEGDYQDQELEHNRPLSRFSFAAPESVTESEGSLPTPTEPVVRRRGAARAVSSASSSPSTPWPKIKVPRWGSGDAKRRAGPSNGVVGPSRARDGPGDGVDDFDVLDSDRDFDSDSPSPLDGEEGVVVDDEACFVDECSSVGTPSDRRAMLALTRSTRYRLSVLAPA